MKKHPKQAFGIFHDGLVVRIVHLVRDGSDVYLQAVDHTELERYWYKIIDDPSISMMDSKTKEDRVAPRSDIAIDEFDNDYVTNFQLQPSERMLASFDLKHGVIALNVYDENICKDNFGAVSKKEMEQFVKSKVPGKQFRHGDWQSAIVTIGGQKQHWLHYGTNRLLDLLKEYQRNSRIQLFYQIADANDIALTDYFKNSYRETLDKDTLLVYLGQEYRKAFLFKNGEWVDTLKLQITQAIPEPEVISSKLALALDSAQITEPEMIVLCGDLANEELVENMKSQFPSEQIEQLQFHHLAMAAENTDTFDPQRLTLHTIPIALAYKALFADEGNYTASNFLPSKVIEGQKVFKVAWHGMLVLLLIFVTTVIATNMILKANLTLRNETIVKRELDFTLEQKRREAAEIQKIRDDLEAQEKNLVILKKLLENKNPWTEVLTIGNRVFAGQPQSWLDNLKVDKGSLYLSGFTTRRAAVIEFANAFADSKIRKVKYNLIRNTSVWEFEIVCSLPTVDWIGLIEKDVEELVKLKLSYGEERQPQGTSEKSKGTLSALKPLSPVKVSNSKLVDKRGKAILPVLPQSSCPVPRDELTNGDGEDVKDYFKFVASANRGNIWEYRDMGTKFIVRHKGSELLPAVRWWMSYRLYLDKEYMLASQYLEPLLSSSDRYQPYALLLKARIDYASGSSHYKDYYDLLQIDYGRHDIIAQVNVDLELIKGGSND